MAAGLAALFQPATLRRFGARFHAWWEGAEPPADDDLLAPAPAGVDAEPEALFDAAPAPRRAPGDPRLEALGLIWGEGRLFLGEATLEADLPHRLGLDPAGTLAVFGPGGPAPLEALARAHPGPIRAFEWRTEAFAALRAAIADAAFAKRVSLEAFDLSGSRLPAESLDGIVSFDEFTFADGAARLAGQMVKALKPGAAAFVEWTAGEPGRDAAPAFAAAFAEPQLRPAAALGQAFAAAGAALETDEDITDAHLAEARACLKAFALGLHQPPAGGLTAMRELAWEAESWAVRRGMMQRGRLARRRLLARRQA